MHLYSRPQLWMLLAIAALAGVGMAVGGWRRAHPDLIERVERFDMEYPGSSAARAGPDPGPGSGGALHAPGSHVSAAHRGGVPSAGPPAALPRPPKLGRAEAPLDLNRATATDLERLPGIGPALARRILSARERARGFTSVEDLKRVPGLGPVKLASLRDLVTVSR